MLDRKALYERLAGKKSKEPDGDEPKVEGDEEKEDLESMIDDAVRKCIRDCFKKYAK